MHELSVTESILNIVLKHAVRNGVRKVLSIRLQIGKLSDLEDEWMQKYFDYLSKGTVAEGAVLKIERLPVAVQCRNCRKPFATELSDIGDIVCPDCGGKDFTLVSGKEYTIKDMEAV